MYKLTTFIALIGCINLSVTAQAINSIHTGVTFTTDPDGNTYMSIQSDGKRGQQYIPNRDHVNKQTLDQQCPHLNSQSRLDDIKTIEPSYIGKTAGYPMDVLFITGSAYDSHQFTLKNESGNVLQNYTYKDSHSLDIADLDKGIYVIEITSVYSGKQYIRKIIKE